MKHVIAFYGSVGASSRTTLVSKKISLPYVIDNVRIKYALGHAATTQHKIFISQDNDAPTSGEPTGHNILEQMGHVDYVVGDDDVMDLPDNSVMHQSPSWLKVLAINTDASNTHTINVLITIDDFRERPGMSQLVEQLGELFNVTGIPSPHEAPAAL